MLALLPFIGVGLIVGTFLLLILTDKLGWTTVYQKRKPGSPPVIGGVLLGAEHIFAPEHRRAAIEYRVESQESLRQQALGED